MKYIVFNILFVLLFQLAVSQPKHRSLVSGGSTSPNIDINIYYNIDEGLSGDIGYWNVEFYNGNSNYIITIYFDPVYSHCFGGAFKSESRVGFIINPGEWVKTGNFMKPTGHNVVCFRLDKLKVEKQIINPRKRNWRKGCFGGWDD